MYTYWDKDCACNCWQTLSALQADKHWVTWNKFLIKKEKFVSLDMNQQTTFSNSFTNFHQTLLFKGHVSYYTWWIISKDTSRSLLDISTKVETGWRSKKEHFVCKGWFKCVSRAIKQCDSDICSGSWCSCMWTVVPGKMSLIISVRVWFCCWWSKKHWREPS